VFPQDLIVGPDTFDPAESFVSANAAYEAGEYAKAIDLYRTLVDHDVHDGHLYYNLGNAYLRNGELGQAIAAYRRCQTLLPRDEDVQANLTFARSSAKDALAPPAPSPVMRTLLFWHYGLSRSELVVGLITLNLLFWGALILRLFLRESELLRWSVIVLLLLVLAAGGSLAVRIVRPARVAVIVPQEIDVRSGTSPDTVIRFKLHAGTEVRAVDVQDGWIRIALPDGQQGWIEEDHAELVSL
jgi:hypothetical protein